MDATNRNKQNENPRSIIWVTALVIILTSLVLDAAVLAWSASVQDWRMVTAEVFTFFVVLSGVAITVWKMKVS